MTVQDVIDLYESEENYVTNSMIVKSFDDYGVTYKFLSRNDQGAFRREVFIATTGTGTLEDRTVTESVEVNDAQ